MNKRYEEGLVNFKRIDGESGAEVIASLNDIAPAVGDYIIEFAFGDIYNRKTLNFREREMITITSLLTQGDTSNQLRVHIQASLNVGLTQSEVIEVFIQCIPYVGFPKVLNAITVAQEVFAKKENRHK